MVSQRADKPRFGVNIEVQLEDWWSTEFLPWYHGTYGDHEITVVVLDPAAVDYFNWTEPLEEELYRVQSGEPSDEVFEGVAGLLQDLRGMLAYVLRTGESSGDARPDLVEPGDFVCVGAGEYEGYTGGAASTNEASNWEAYKRVVRKVKELRAAAATAAIALSRDPREGLGAATRYLEAAWEIGSDGQQQRANRA